MNEHYPFVNPPLPYAYDALEPYIDARTMMLHYNRHLQTYVDNLNRILKNYPQYQSFSLEGLLLYQSSLPSEIQIPVHNNAGGVYNHIFFFSNLKAPDSQKLSLPCSTFINSVFGSFDAFLDAFRKAALSVFGSGYAWLVMDMTGRLNIITTANQDTPLPQNLFPLLNLDVWEHAYYLKHYNNRDDYITDWFHVIDWDRVSTSCYKNNNMLRNTKSYSQDCRIHSQQSR